MLEALKFETAYLYQIEAYVALVEMMDTKACHVVILTQVSLKARQRTEFL